MWAEADVAGAGVVGGDVSSASTLVVAVTALGSLEGRAPVTRSGARPGDVVAVAGRLGWAAAGLAVLGRGFRSPGVLVDAQRTPQPPYAAGPAAARAGATSMIDVSDGLLADLGHVARASGVVIALDREAFGIPYRLGEIASALGADPLELDPHRWRGPRAGRDVRPGHDAARELHGDRPGLHGRARRARRRRGARRRSRLAALPARLIAVAQDALRQNRNTRRSAFRMPGCPGTERCGVG